MAPETLTLLLREMATDFAFSPADIEALGPQVLRMLEALARLDELPLASVEPASNFKVIP